MEKKWDYELSQEERRQYPLENVIVLYDRIYDEYLTAAGTRLDGFLEPIKEPRNKRLIRIDEWLLL